MPDLLHRAAIEPTEATVNLRPLPEPAVELLVGAAGSPRLAAHLRAVHDVACDLVDFFRSQWPAFEFDADAVRFGAATHDIGKARHPDELSGPGSAHEPDGYALLIAAGLPDSQARFARTHAAWNEPDATVEDLLVALADKVWKARREEGLEQQIVERIAAVTGLESWQVFVELDDRLSAIAEGADARLEFQAGYPTE